MADSRRTVLYLTPSVRLLGARRSLLSLAAHLDRERWRPIVCGQSHGDLEDALAEHDIPFEVVKLGWWRKGRYFLWRPFVISRLAALIARVGADIVHCNEIYSNPYAIRACAQAARELGREPPVITHMRLTITPRMIRNYDLIRAAKIVVPSEEAGHDFDVWPDKDERVRVIHNGVDLSEFHRERPQEVARRSVGLPEAGFLFAAIGQLGPRKGGDVILRAFEKIAPDFPGACLVFVGNPHRGQEDFARELRSLSTRPALAGRVTFFSFTRDILPFYESLDANLLVSRSEGFGRTIIEAAALGAPSIGARVGGIPELIEHGRTGLLVESENETELAEAMARMMKDIPSMKTMGEMAFRKTAQQFSIQTHAGEMMNLYDAHCAAARA